MQGPGNKQAIPAIGRGGRRRSTWWSGISMGGRPEAVGGRRLMARKQRRCYMPVCRQIAKMLLRPRRRSSRYIEGALQFPPVPPTPSRLPPFTLTYVLAPSSSFFVCARSCQRTRRLARFRPLPKTYQSLLLPVFLPHNTLDAPHRPPIPILHGRCDQDG